jgi:hypothetical protein
MAAAPAAHGVVEHDEPPELVDFQSSDEEEDDDDLFHLFCSVAPPLPGEVGGSDAAEELDRQLLDVLLPGLWEELAARISAVRAEIDEAHTAAAKAQLDEEERRLDQAQAALEWDVRSALGLGDELGPAEAARLFDAEGIERLPQGSKRLPERQHVCPRKECGCVESWYFADRARTVQYETTCAQVDRLWLAKQTGSREMEEAKALKAVASQYKGTGNAAPIVSERPRKVAKAADGTSAASSAASDATVGSTASDDPVAKQQAERVARAAAAMRDEAAKLASSRVVHTPPDVAFEQYVCAQAQVLSQVAIPDREKKGLCLAGRCSVLRCMPNYFTTRLDKLDGQTRNEALGLARPSPGRSVLLDWTKIRNPDDMPRCCSTGRCLREKLPARVIQRLAQQCSQVDLSQAEKHELAKEVCFRFAGANLCSKATQLLLGVSSQQVSRAQAARQLFLSEGLSTETKHGNTGREPANKTDAADIFAIKGFLESVTWQDPGHTSKDGMTIARPFSTEVEGDSRLWRFFQDTCAEVAGRMTQTTFVYYVTLWFAVQHCKRLKLASDHNVCKLCKSLMVEMLVKWREWKQKVDEVKKQELLSPERHRANAEAGVLFAEYEDAKAQLKRHNARNMQIRAMKNRQIAVAKAAALDASCTAQTSVKHNDDASAVPYPSVKDSSTAMQHTIKAAVHGEADCVAGECSIYLPEPGVGSGDTNYTLECIVLDIIMTKRVGDEVLWLVSDCGPHQHNHFMLSLAQWLVDHGFYSFVVLLYLEQEHSKMDCDAIFGILKQAFKHVTLLSFECLGRTAAKHPRKASADKKYKVLALHVSPLLAASTTLTM